MAITDTQRTRTTILDYLSRHTQGVAAADIAAALALGRSTVTKHLASLEADGQVRREAGQREGRRRPPDLWHPAREAAAHAEEASTAPEDTAPSGTPETANTLLAGDGHASAESAKAPDPSPPEPQPSEPEAFEGDAEAGPADGGESPGDPGEDSFAADSGGPAAGATPTSAAPAAGGAADGRATASADDQDPVDPAGLPEPAEEGAAQLGPVSGGAEAQPQQQVNRVSGTNRLRAGGLRQLVEEVLRAAPEAVFSPVEVTRLVGSGRSSGAVSNALERLVKEGTAVLTQDKPKRYQAAAGQ